MRLQKEIEADIRLIAENFPEVEELTHITCHYLNETLTIQIEIVTDPEKQIQEARVIAGYLKKALEQIEDIESADIHLQL